MNDTEVQKAFYHPVCNEQEIERILNVENASDYLLKLRADTIVDHMRLYRVYRNKALLNEKTWSLEKSFDTSHYDSFLSYLSPSNKENCLELTFGNIFSNEPDGLIFKTDYGPIITISDSIQFFLKFCNLALLSFKSDVPAFIRINAIRIAVRVMLKTEALDFLMDPRGMVPTDVGEAMHEPILHQLQFIAGHEFSHFLLGHLSDSNVTSKPIYKAITANDTDYKPMNVFNQSQKEELDADLKSISLPQYDIDTNVNIIEAALLWFGSLELFQCALNTLYPQNPWQYQSHPSARDRFNNILSNIKIPNDVDTKMWKTFIENVDYYKAFLINDISHHIEIYDTYGSVYLDKPNTKWRGPELKDRVDYY